MEHRSFPEDRTGIADRRASAPSQLSARVPFGLGNARVIPSLKTLEGPQASAAVEPRVMQVLLALADAGEGVVTRADLVAACWSGAIVGDDSINRAISEVRRAARETGADLTVETVPKIGYRLFVPQRPPNAESPPRPIASRMTRRVAMTGAGAALLATAGVGLRMLRHRRDPRVADLVAQGRQALRDEMPDGTRQGIGFFREAIGRAPGDAEVWGLLSLAYRNQSEFAPASQIASAVKACEGAARHALELDPDQADALAALALLPPFFGDWAAAEDRLRRVAARHPEQADVASGLSMLMYSVGRVRAAAGFSLRAAQLDALSPIFQYRRAYHQWSLGNPGDADRTLDRALQLWPDHPAVRFARLLLFVGTGRFGAARRVLDDRDAPPMMPPPVVSAWQATCTALIALRPEDRRVAVAAHMAAAGGSAAASVSAILALSALGAPDEAFLVADGYLLRQGPIIVDIGGGGRSIANDQRWRKTMMLFTPVTAPLRADRRFGVLCRDMGLARYWRATGSMPDYQRA